MRATISGDEGRGYIKLIVAKDTDKLVGAHLVGPEVGEIMQARTPSPPHPLTHTAPAGPLFPRASTGARRRAGPRRLPVLRRWGE